jgi:DNA-binding transcriptional LysR family regulator
MTLQQLQYIITTVSCGSISEAAKQLYISQPSLTSAIHELEKELKITIFNRSNKGVTLTPDGEEFLGYARQVIDQTNLIRERYSDQTAGKRNLCISTQHYSFAVEAFIDLIRDYGGDEYSFRLRETQTYEIIEDVARLRSEIGILYLNPFNETVLKKALRANELTFHPLFVAKPHIFTSKFSPLAQKEIVSLDDLTEYPRLSFEQGEHNSFYFSEEIFSTLDSKKEIMVRDRATLFNLVIGLNGYTISSGMLSQELNSDAIVSIPLDTEDYMELGYVTHSKMMLSRLASLYLDLLKSHLPKLDQTFPL